MLYMEEVGIEAERQAEAELAQGSAAEPAFCGLPVAKRIPISGWYYAIPISGYISLTIYYCKGNFRA